MKILIATPLHGFPVPQYLESIVESLDLLNADMLVHPGALVAASRNELTSKFLSGTWDVLLFADADEKWRAEDARVLAEAALTLGVAGSPVPYKKRDWATLHRRVLEGCPVEQVHLQGLSFNFWLDPKDCSKNGYVGPRCVVAGQEFVRVSFLGTGLMAISRKVLDDMSSRLRIDGYADLFPQGPRGGKYMGEDIGFCNLYHHRGDGHIWMAHEMRVVHYGQEAFEGVVSIENEAIDAYVAGGGSK